MREGHMLRDPWSLWKGSGEEGQVLTVPLCLSAALFCRPLYIAYLVMGGVTVFGMYVIYLHGRITAE